MGPATVQHRERWLQAVNRAELSGGRQTLTPEIAEADGADFLLIPKGQQGFHGLADRRFGGGPMAQVDVDDLHAQATKAGLALSLDAFGRKIAFG